MRFALLLLAGCWTGVATPAPVPPPPAPAARVDPEVHIPAHSEWAGTYVCGQGLTGMRLVVDVHDSQARAVFSFAAVEENPGVPSGSFVLVGPARATPDHEVVFELQPAQWIDQPDGYIMVPLTAFTEKHKRAMRGQVHHETCAGIDLHRVR